MKLTRQLIIPSGLSIGLLAMFVAFQNCGSNSSVKKQVEDQSDSIVQTNLRVNDLNNILFGMVENERQERINSDIQILGQITTLRGELTSQISELNTSVTRMDKTIVGLSEQDKKFSSEVSSLESASMELEKRLSLKLFNTELSLQGAIRDNRQELASHLSQLDTTIANLRESSMENANDIINQRNQILALMSAQGSFEKYVSETFATKSELAVQKSLYDSLEYFVRSLDLRLTRTSQEVSETLGQRIFDLTQKVSSIEAKVTSQGKDIETLRSDLSSAINEYKEQNVEFTSKVREEIARVESQLGTLMINQNDLLRSEVMTELAKQGLELTLYTNKSVTFLSNALGELSKKVDSTNTDQSAALAQVRKQMVDAIINEQEERKNLSLDVHQLVLRVMRVETEILDLQNIAEANSRMTRRISVDFEIEKTSVAARFKLQDETIQAKFSQLQQDFDKKLKEVATHAESLVKNLGTEVQENFKSVSLEIATLTTRQAGVEKQLSNMLEEYQQDRSRTSTFAARISSPFRQAQGHLVSTIDALSMLQLRFVQVLAPDEENPDFYNDDLKKRLEILNKKCDSVAVTSFANALGMDSFQILSIEYTRLLLSGLNSGDPERDLIFHKFGPAAGNDRLTQAVGTALVQAPFGDVDKSCQYEVQQWARSILLTDKRFIPLAQALSNDDEFERRLSVLYESFQNAADPMEEIHKHIVSAVEGSKDRDKIFDSMVIQTARDLVNAAWDSRQLSDRLAILDGLEKVQTAQSETQEEMRNGFAELRQKLKGFELQTNGRLSHLEDQQGKMSLALKRGLDVLISLADRGGYPDLRAYAQWAGSAIEYSPVIYPNWKPRISMVQHFFAGPLSLKNKTDACTGSKILSQAGIQGAYQFGTWGPCWVNFRSLPLPKWGNEFKTLWLRIFGAAHLITLTVDPAAQKEQHPMFKNYNYSRKFDFREDNSNPLIKLTGTFDNGVFDIMVPDLLDYYLKNIRTWGGVTVSVEAERQAAVGSEQIITNSQIFKYTIQVFSPLIIDIHKSGLPSTISSQSSKVSINFTNPKKLEKSGWVKGSEAAFLIKSDLEIGTPLRRQHLFIEGETCDGYNAKDGFAALECLDKNGDGSIDLQDAKFSSLRAFFDYDADGIVDQGEIRLLSELGIVSLSLLHETIPENIGLNNGNDLRYKAKIFGKDGASVGKLIDIYFGVEQ